MTKDFLQPFFGLDLVVDPRRAASKTIPDDAQRDAWSFLDGPPQLLDFLSAEHR